MQTIKEATKCSRRLTAMNNLSDYFALKYRPLKLRTASENTLKLWVYAIRNFDRHLSRPARLADLTDDNLSSFAEARLNQVSSASVNRDLASLLALWRFASRQGVASGWPHLDLCKEPRRVPVAWTQEEFNRLIACVTRLDGAVGEHPARLWWHALMLVAFDSGERIGALLGLRWECVDLSAGWITFQAETRKGAREDSIVCIAPDTAETLRLIRRKSGLVFRWPMSRSYIWAKLGAILDAAGLPSDRRRKFHCVRRTVASYVEASGGNATNILRHSCRRTTLAYLDPRIVKEKNAIDYLWRPSE